MDSETTTGLFSTEDTTRPSWRRRPCPAGRSSRYTPWTPTSQKMVSSILNRLMTSLTGSPPRVYYSVADSHFEYRSSTRPMRGFFSVDQNTGQVVLVEPVKYGHRPNIRVSSISVSSSEVSSISGFKPRMAFSRRPRRTSSPSGSSFTTTATSSSRPFTKVRKK